MIQRMEVNEALAPVVACMLLQHPSLDLRFLEELDPALCNSVFVSNHSKAVRDGEMERRRLLAAKRID